MLAQIKKTFQVNRIIKYFIFSDFFFISGWGLVSPIFAIFIVQKIAGATILTVGIAATIYWVLRAFFQLPIAAYLDKTQGEKDDFYVLIGGLVLASIVAFLFIFIGEIWQLYVLQIVHALALAMYVPSWTAIFSRHLDKNRYAFDWAFDNAFVSLSAGLTAVTGAWLASAFGFQIIFIGASILTFLAAVLIFLTPQIVLPKPASKQPLPPRDHRPQNLNR